MPESFNFVRLSCILIRHRNVMKAVCQVVLLARLLDVKLQHGFGLRKNFSTNERIIRRMMLFLRRTPETDLLQDVSH